MSAYSRTNLKQVEDSAASVPELEARFARKHLDSTELGVSYFRYAPGFQAPTAHHHKVQEEAYVVVSGSGRIKIEDDILELNPWDVVRVAPEAKRGFESGPDGLEIIAIGGHKPEEGDGVRVENFWSTD
jgi:mannose-6-phosphate isomerase-like protein (cupin superfamily)